MKRRHPATEVCLALVVLVGSAIAQPLDDSPPAIEKRLADAARYLSSDELEGRGLGSRGLELAAEFIAREFHEAGLVTDLCRKSPFQKFSVATDAELGGDNHVALVGPANGDGKPVTVELALGKDYTPLAISGSRRFDLPLVFAGFGLTAPKEDYDDYGAIDVTGKAVIVLRHSPDPTGTRVSKAKSRDKAATADAAKSDAAIGMKDYPYSLFRHKASNAYEHGAAAVLFCTDLSELRGRKRQDDHVLSFQIAGTTHAHSDLPVMHFRREVIDHALRSACGKTIADLEQDINCSESPQSIELKGWRLVGRTNIRHVQTEIKNVVGMLPGDGPHADETIVLGAHYDHLGYGSHSSLPAKPKEIYSGADDNASGVSVMLEVARRLTRRPQHVHRRVVFVAFTGEEWGFFGSSYYVNHPPVPLEKTVAMVNLDMVGRLREDKVTVNCTGTGTGFNEILDSLGPRHGLTIVKQPGASGRSDQASFYAKKIANLHFITGRHADYHRPTDKFPKLNIPGMRRVAGLVEDTVLALADQPERTRYIAVQAQPRSGDTPPPYLGILPDITREEPGYAISGVISASPAERAGIRAGDIIVHFGKSRIGTQDDFDDALRKCSGGERVKVRVRRGAASMLFEVTLETPK